MHDALLIRSLRAEDLDALLALYGDLHANDDPAARETLAAVWDSILRNAGRIFVGGFCDGVLVSSCNAAIIANLTRGARPYAVIEQVVTHHDYRRRGFGAQTMRHLLERCWELRCYKVSLTSGVQRDEAHQFYEALGFDRDAKQAFVITRR
jgi:GNAT superfamily N-acetyltransferase